MKDTEDLFTLDLPTYPMVRLSSQERSRHLAIRGGVDYIKTKLLHSILEQDIQRISYSNRFARQFDRIDSPRRMKGITIFTEKEKVPLIKCMAAKYRIKNVTDWNPFETPKWNQPAPMDLLKRYPFDELVTKGGILIVTLDGEASEAGKVCLREMIFRLLEAMNRHSFDYISSIIIENLNRLISLAKEKQLLLFPTNDCAVTCWYAPEQLGDMENQYIDRLIMNKLDFEQPAQGTAHLANFRIKKTFQFTYK